MYFFVLINVSSGKKEIRPETSEKKRAVPKLPDLLFAAIAFFSGQNRMLTPAANKANQHLKLSLFPPTPYSPPHTQPPLVCAAGEDDHFAIGMICKPITACTLL